MNEPTHTSTARKPSDPSARQRLRQAQLAESRALSRVCDAEARLKTAIARRDSAYATADGWVAAASALLDGARAELAVVSGLDRAALLLGIGKAELRRSAVSATARMPREHLA
jgi:hypothetical protein